jgi:hypothetical protein
MCEDSYHKSDVLLQECTRVDAHMGIIEVTEARDYCTHVHVDNAHMSESRQKRIGYCINVHMMMYM